MNMFLTYSKLHLVRWAQSADTWPSKLKQCQLFKCWKKSLLLNGCKKFFFLLTRYMKQCLNNIAITTLAQLAKFKHWLQLVNNNIFYCFTERKDLMKKSVEIAVMCLLNTVFQMLRLICAAIGKTYLFYCYFYNFNSYCINCHANMMFPLCGQKENY